MQQPPMLAPWEGRAVLLVDLDAFFASVEQMDHPEWKGKPVIVGGDPTRRGVVSTASYEARQYGVRSAMPSATAAKLCPEAIWTHGNYSRYREVSDQVMEILSHETPFMQQVSIDEAFLDISPTPYRSEHPVLVAQRIRRRVKELGITCSIGLGVSKSVAKIASDADKPDGLTVVFPGREADYLAPLPISCMSGVGEVAQSKLSNFGIRTLGELAHAEPSLLQSVFGKNARVMQLRSLGQDRDPVRDERDVKSVSAEMSFATSLACRRDIDNALSTMASKVCRRLRKKSLRASAFTLKLRYESLNIRTAQTGIAEPTNDEYEVVARLRPLVSSLWTEGMLVRLVGVAASGFGASELDTAQDRLFDIDESSTPEESPKLDKLRRAGLIAATDRIRDRFGERAVNFGHENATLDESTGTAAKNPEDYR